MQFAFGSYMAQVAEVSVGPDGDVRVHRVVCAVDCGQNVNPDTIVAQMEGGIVFGASAGAVGRGRRSTRAACSRPTSPTTA